MLLILCCKHFETHLFVTFTVQWHTTTWRGGVATVVPMKGRTQVPMPPFLGIPRFQIPPNGYSLQSAWQSLDRHLAEDGGLLMARWCENIRWHTGICVLIAFRYAYTYYHKLYFRYLKIAFHFSLGTTITQQGCLLANNWALSLLFARVPPILGLESSAIGCHRTHERIGGGCGLSYFCWGWILLQTRQWLAWSIQIEINLFKSHQPRSWIMSRVNIENDGHHHQQHRVT